MTEKPKPEMLPTLPEAAHKKMEYIPREDVPTFYANNANMRATFWDLRIEWGLIAEADANRILVHPQAATLLSWPHAKILVHLLANVVAGYEKQFGEIKIPKGNIKTADE